MNLRLQLKRVADALTLANRCQAALYTQTRCFSDTKKTVEELLAENADYKKQIDDLKNKNVELISTNLGCMSQISKLKNKNAEVEDKINDILVRGDSMSHAYISERVRYAHEVSTLTEHIWHLLSILAQSREAFVRKASEQATASEFRSKPKTVGEAKQKIEELFVQVEKLQRQLESSKREIDALEGIQIDLTQDFQLLTSREQPEAEQKDIPPNPHEQSNRAVKDMIDLTKALHKKKQYNEAIDLLLKAVHIEQAGRKDTKILSQLWFKLSVIYQEDANHAKALEAANNAIDCNPKHTPNYFRRASIYAALGEKSKAIEDLRTVVELNPDHAYTKDLLGLLTI